MFSNFKSNLIIALSLVPALSFADPIIGQDDGTCTPTMVHIMAGEESEIVLQASEVEMFMLTAPDLGIELMAMPGESARVLVTPEEAGTFPFTCGKHGAPEEEQTLGEFMVM